MEGCSASDRLLQNPKGHGTIVGVRNASVTILPSERELLDFFGGEPTEASPEEGFWCYDAADGTGIKLRFSFSIHETSVQTILSFGGREIETVVQEGAEELRIEGGSLIGALCLGATTRHD